jgi:hypothetical protein
MGALFRHPGGAAPNLLAITYAGLAWSAGVSFLTAI